MAETGCRGIINNLIDISKIESGQMEIKSSSVNINDKIETLYHFFKPETDRKGIGLTVMKSLSEEQATIFTDQEKVFAILTNLIKNAIKFTGVGSIDFGYKKKAGHLEFFVSDTGVGIPPNMIEVIFQRFRQVSESLTRNYEGAGLGLTISKAYVEMLGGKIWVESEKGKGSTFYFTLPCGIPSMDEV
jgi:signal transduction histidine kinase